MWGLYIAGIWTVLSLLVAATLGTWVLIAAIAALILAWAYSAPPFRLKRNGWWGNAACGFSYESLAWITGAAAMLGGILPPAQVLVIAILYGIGAHGIMTLNDFKAIKGDREMGINSLPVMLGPDRAAQVACAIMAAPQFVVIALLLFWGQPIEAGIVVLLLIGQLVMMRRFVRAPVAQATWYSGIGVPLFVFGMMASAVAVRVFAAA
jgi:chlorophyll synthase